MQNFKVRLVLSEDISPSEKTKLELAAKKMESVICSEDFKEWCLNFSYPIQSCTGRLWWKKCHTETRKCFADNKGLTNYQVYNQLMSGRETLDPIEDHEADIYLEIDRRIRRRVVGYTYPNTKWQWIYNWVLTSWSINDIAGNLAHEYAHKTGWDHAYNWTPTREYSVPYAVGYYVSNYLKANS